MLAIHSNNVCRNVSRLLKVNQSEYIFIIQLYSPAPPEAERHADPCLPSPCGSNSVCRNVNNRAECSCAPGMFGAPPNCRPECVINQDCPSNRACIRQRCEDPCIGICGFNAVCSTQNHQPKCSCIESFEGDPYTACRMRESEYRSLDYLLSFPGARMCARDAPLMLNVPFSGALEVLVLWCTSHACSSYCVYIMSFIYVPIYLLLLSLLLLFSLKSIVFVHSSVCIRIACLLFS